MHTKKQWIRIGLLLISVSIPIAYVLIHLLEGEVTLHEAGHLGLFGAICYCIDNIFLNA